MGYSLEQMMNTLSEEKQNLCERLLTDAKKNFKKDHCTIKLTFGIYHLTMKYSRLVK